MNVLIITISDRAFNKVYEDLSGARIEEILREKILDLHIERIIVPDEEAKILDGLNSFSNFDFIITNGGTGIGPRDITPEITEKFCDKLLPGISETLRAESYKETKFSVLSRGSAGLKGKTIIVNFPGSTKACTLYTKVFSEIMDHAFKMVHGQGH